MTPPHAGAGVAELVAVEQLDREAAAHLLGKTLWSRNQFLDGKRDKHEAVQAFARHRLTALSRDGWVLVPREPTKAMIAAGLTGLSDAGVDNVREGDALACYSAMLSALPTPPEKGPA